MDNLQWLAELDPEKDLTEHYREVVEVIGLENTIKLAEAFPSMSIYLKNPNKLLLPVKIRYVRKHFNKHNHRKLARITGLSERYIYKLVEKKETEDAQLSLLS
jgi:Mor family transcriptional regulator